jgi:hypothetical protein
MTRVFAYYLILVGLLQLADAAYDEQRGVAAAVSPGGVSAPLLYVIKRADDPEGFRSLMFYQWSQGPAVLLAGFWILGLSRRANRVDPFSPDFAGNQALDDLNRTLTEEQAKRHRPLR